jgi:hypothetical protein
MICDSNLMDSAFWPVRSAMIAMTLSFYIRHGFTFRCGRFPKGPTPRQGGL